ncbi:MAG: hypothetical protein M0R06_11500 [Sphaerochaeta sp.]|jgi:hypothetical protein|nr:hypothetical protein [Sphaerochaeta sp.]
MATFKQAVEEITCGICKFKAWCEFDARERNAGTDVDPVKDCGHLKAILAAHNAELDRIAEGTDGIALIAQERNRQIKAEGWTEEHDKQHSRGELSMAATCYTLVAVDQIKKYPSAEVMPSFWPWHHLWWKPTKDPIRNLVKAGALIAAEIDRIQAYIQAQKGS